MRGRIGVVWPNGSTDRKVLNRLSCVQKENVKCASGRASCAGEFFLSREICWIVRWSLCRSLRLSKALLWFGFVDCSAQRL